MAARILCKSLLRHRTRRHTSLKSPPLIPLYLHHRHRSSKPELIEINLSSPSFQSDGGSEEDEGFLMKKLEEILHRMMLKKSTPDWLPFRPGSSFWVPPMMSVRDAVYKFAGSSLSDQEALSLTTCRGWPSSSYFIKAGINVESKDEEEEEEEHADVKGELAEEVEGKVVVRVLTGATDINVEVREKGQVDIKVNPKKGDEVEREVLVPGDEVEGKVELLILAGSSLENEEG